MGEPNSMWKKEISFRRKQASPPSDDSAGARGAAPSPEEGSKPLSKKEISFRRKATAAPSEESARDRASARTPRDGSTPFWKKEIAFGRKQAPPATGDSATDAGSAANEGEGSTPFWKKEFSFRRKHASAPTDASSFEGASAAASAGTSSASSWKKELSFGRKRTRREPEAVVAAVEPEKPAHGAEPSAAEVLAVEQRPPAGPAAPAPSNTRAPQRRAPQETPRREPAAETARERGSASVPTRAPSDALPPAPTPAMPPVPPRANHPQSADATTGVTLPVPGGATQPSDAPAPTSASAPVPARAAGLQPSAHAPTPPTAGVPPATRQPAAPATTPAATSLPVRASDPRPAAPAAATVVVHPPVTADQLPPLPGEAEQPKKKEKGARGAFARRGRGLGRNEGRTQASAGKTAKRLVGLKVGASQISAATVSNNGQAEVLQLARTPLGSGIVHAGELRDPDALAGALKDFFSEHKLPRRGVRLGIATNRIGVRALEISGINDPKQLANAIRFRAQEALPIPIDEAVLDYQVLSETTNDDGETSRQILLVLAYRDLIDRYVGACRKAGIGLVGIDLEAFALLRALAAPPEDGARRNAALVAVTLGHERTTFAVSDGRVCEFTRVLDWGGATLNVALARVLDAAPSEVTGIKHALSLDSADVPEGLTPEQAQLCREALRRQVQVFARELVSSLQFYQNQPESLGIGEIVITGGTAHLSGFAAELEQLIGVRVRVGDPLVRVKLGKRFAHPEQVGSLAVAIGLGIED